MLLGLSIIFASASILVYRHPLSSWPGLFRRRGRGVAAPSTLNGRPTAGHDLDRDEPPTQIQKDASLPASPDATPKTRVTAANGLVPTFSLSPSALSDDEDATDDLQPPSFPAANSIQRAGNSQSRDARRTAMSLTTPQAATPTQLMPPPPRPRPAQPSLSPPSIPGSTRVPSNGPLPNRRPTSNGALGLPASAPARKTPNARQKVELAPGHSPLDWALLQKSGADLAGVPRLIRVTPSQLRRCNGRKGRPAWSTWQGRVYNITPYLPFHPGGRGELMRAAGRDGEALFLDVHPWVNWENMLGECLVGILVGENDGVGDDGGGGDMEQID